MGHRHVEASSRSVGTGRWWRPASRRRARVRAQHERRRGRRRRVDHQLAHLLRRAPKPRWSASPSSWPPAPAARRGRASCTGRRARGVASTRRPAPARSARSRSLSAPRRALLLRQADAGGMPCRPLPTIGASRSFASTACCAAVSPVGGAPTAAAVQPAGDGVAVRDERRRARRDLGGLRGEGGRRLGRRDERLGGRGEEGGDRVELRVGVRRRRLVLRDVRAHDLLDQAVDEVRQAERVGRRAVEEGDLGRHVGRRERADRGDLEGRLQREVVILVEDLLLRRRVAARERRGRGRSAGVRRETAKRGGGRGAGVERGGGRATIWAAWGTRAPGSGGVREVCARVGARARGLTSSLPLRGRRCARRPTC